MLLKSILFFIISVSLIFQPIISFADDCIDEDILYLDNLEIEISSDLSEEPVLNARHAIIFDRSSKTVLFGKLENETCKIASTTKIMTAIVTIENCENLDEIVKISKNAARNRRFKAWLIHK